MIQIDIKMPKDCYHCPCHKHWDVNNYICGVTGDTANYMGFRYDFCPLKEVSNEPVLDKIKDEIEDRLYKISDGSTYLDIEREFVRDEIFKIIDGHEESEE